MIDRNNFYVLIWIVMLAMLMVDADNKLLINLFPHYLTSFDFIWRFDWFKTIIYDLTIECDRTSELKWERNGWRIAGSIKR